MIDPIRVSERDTTELPFVRQLAASGWKYLEGDTEVPELTERTTFRQVLLVDRLRRAIRALNRDRADQPWVDDAQAGRAITELERTGAAGGLVATNQAVMELLLSGTAVETGEEGRDRARTVHFIDWEHPDRNDYLGINQFRVDPVLPSRPSTIPDIVLFVNGIPLVVVEAKSPLVSEPLDAAITQLLRYSNQRDRETQEGAERLFHFNALMVATSFFQARLAGVGASYEHYMRWVDTAPIPKEHVAAELRVATLTEQQSLIAGALRPANLMDIVRNFTVFDRESGVLVKKVARYQQYRAVVWACERLASTPAKVPGRLDDGRGGIVWHTQGSGKSLTMVFLVRRMRSLPRLRRFKVVVVTDRTDLEDQLGATAALTGEAVERARNRDDLVAKLRRPGTGLLMAMLQKYRPTDEQVAGVDDGAAFPVCNESDEILILIDEGHRGQTGELHANLMQALPNAAKIAFTGTPILMGDRRRTTEVFGDFIDTYTIRTSEEDGATVPIWYEGREARAHVASPEQLERELRAAYPDAGPEELEAARRKLTAGNVLQAPTSIEAKAEDMFRHYVDTVMPGGFKAQVVAVSREATVRYRDALAGARDRLVADLQADAVDLAAIPEDGIAELEGEAGFRARAFRALPLIRRLEFGAVISGRQNDVPHLLPWSDAAANKGRIADFKKPLLHDDPDKASALAFLCVKSMLLVGFDAKWEQVLYLDRLLQGAELLQAIARVNRTTHGKENGLVVDYFGLGDRLSDALAVYDAGEIEGAVKAVSDALPLLEARYERVLTILGDAGLTLNQIEACVELLGDTRLRAVFVVRLREFLDTLDAVMPRPAATRYLRPATVLGLIATEARRRYRDATDAPLGAGRKIQALINAHLEAEGIDVRVPPMAITDARFDEVVRSRPSSRAKATEMIHAARHHITVNFETDPARYRKLSERLQGILDRFADNWDQLVEQLELFTEDVRAEEQAVDATGLDSRTEAPFFRILNAELGATREQPAVIESTRGLVALVKAEISAVDFWRNTHAQEVLRSHILQYLDERDLVPDFAQIDRVVDDVMAVARAQHGRLVT